MGNNVKGYKVFNADWTCRDFQYEIGKTYEEDVDLHVCGRGFHFCKDIKDCFNYYKFDPNNKVAEIIALGEVEEDDDKCCTNKIQLLREISWEEVLKLVNTGKGCTGLGNSGNYNSGFGNSGHCNSGNRNSGDRNSGNYNSGHCNSGDCNSRDYNSGYCNSGDYNSGDRNSGYCNSGDWNSGDCNSGYYNSGNYNSGDWNSGDWNMGSYATGCFNTETQKLNFFDKETNMTFEEWNYSDAKRLLDQIDFRPTSWIYSNKMTDEEKAEYPKYETTGGYLKNRDNTDATTEWWNGLLDCEKNTIENIPNFDAEKFFKITGIEVE